MKKFILATLMILVTLFLDLPSPIALYAAEEDGVIYQIFNQNDEFLTERQGVEIGDKYIDGNLNEFEIIFVDSTQGIAKAKYIQTYKKPKIVKKNVEEISASPKTIALYMSHNDESYLIGDGTASVYGAGGIHDVAKKLKNELERLGISVNLDETLHIPHDSKAYTRSNVTANKLMKANPDAIFDIHRDGASRNTYLTTVNGVERSKIRIVLGQSNPNSQQNLQFALQLLSLSEQDYPWLFHDIYWGKGHYNQALSDKALLFEMGTHTIEKDYVLDTTEYLARVINDALYKTRVENYSSAPIEKDSEASGASISEGAKLVVIIVPSLVGLTAIVVAVAIYNKKGKKK